MTPIHITIDDEPYAFSPCEFGYRVVPTRERIARIGRSYLVTLNRDGVPQSCSCPDCVYRARRCKHLSALQAYFEALTFALQGGAE